MTKVIAHMTMSLDGFIADPNDGCDELFGWYDNGDGLLDLICQFDTKKAGLTCTSTTATVMGYTVDGRRFEGQDDIKITGC